jgi:hypothetical protein
MSRFRLLAIAVALGALLVIAPVAVAAGNAHFIKSQTTASLSGSSLQVNFKEAGLASGSVETVTLSASQFVTYECVNGGGKNPSASNKHSFVTTTSVSGTFTADKNGNIVGSLTLAVAPDTSSCPPGQTDTLVSVTYSNITLTDSTSGASISIPGSFTYTNPLAPPIRG